LATKQEDWSFVNSARGQYIIGQALHLAVESLSTVEPSLRENSNIEDMEFLIESAFPMYRAIVQAQDMHNSE